MNRLTRVIFLLFPRRKLWRVSRELSADYERSGITYEESLIMAAGLARDPAAARRVIIELDDKYGDGMWDYVRLIVWRKRRVALADQFYNLLLKIFGGVHPDKKQPKRKLQARIDVDFRHKDGSKLGN